MVLGFIQAKFVGFIMSPNIGLRSDHPQISSSTLEMFDPRQGILEISYQLEIWSNYSI